MSVLEGYLALSRFRLGQTLDQRTALLAACRAAELGGCRWCIERARHECRVAGFSPEGSGTEQDQAALGFVEAVARAHAGAAVAPHAFQAAEALFQPGQLAELARIAADNHCLEKPMPKPVQP
jgi:hypothetical protein